MRESNVKTPELDKMRIVKAKSQAIVEFLDWLERNKDIELCARHEIGDELYSCASSGITVEHLLAEHFGIDLVKVEEEKRALIDEIAAKSA